MNLSNAAVRRLQGFLTSKCEVLIGLYKMLKGKSHTPNCRTPQGVKEERSTAVITPANYCEPSTVRVG